MNKSDIFFKVMYINLEKKKEDSNIHKLTNCGSKYSVSSVLHIGITMFNFGLKFVIPSCYNIE